MRDQPRHRDRCARPGGGDRGRLTDRSVDRSLVPSSPRWLCRSVVSSSASQLAQAVWGDDEDGRPERTLQVYVSTLRKALEPDRRGDAPGARDPTAGICAARRGRRPRPGSFRPDARSRPSRARHRRRARRHHMDRRLEAMAGACVRRPSRPRVVRHSRHEVGRAAARHRRGPVRRAPHVRWPRRGDHTAGSPDLGAPIPRAPAGPTDARVVPNRSAGRRTRRLPQHAADAGRRVGDRTGRGPTAARATHPRPGPDADRPTVRRRRCHDRHAPTGADAASWCFPTANGSR